jgi:hypothetical protein
MVRTVGSPSNEPTVPTSHASDTLGRSRDGQKWAPSASATAVLLE